ncbi:hypothetical protein [Gracilimonas halophila]|uniref:Uncharacterized protein n=1 Tax=Gracilimonas halophila TaxID=1834464 RepID=A0ABW5JL15_9BACT
MSNKGKYKQYKFENDLDRGNDHDPDFDLDEYIHQQSIDNPTSTGMQAPVDEETSQFKNAILMFLVFAAAFLWANDWSPTQAWGSIFGSEESATEVTSTAPSFTIPAIPDIPEVPALPRIGNESGYVNFLIEINEAGLSDVYSSPALQAFYQSDVPISYLSELVEAGYQEFSYPEIIAFYNAEIPLEYLNTLNEYGFLSEFSYPEVIAYYNADVSIEYLTTLSESGFLPEFSYPEVIAYYNNVTIEYLRTLDEAGYLADLSYPAVIAFSNNNITIEFLNQLRDNNLLENMSYPEVVSAFNTDN